MNQTPDQNQGIELANGDNAQAPFTQSVKEQKPSRFALWWDRNASEFGKFYKRNTAAIWLGIVGFIIAVSIFSIGFFQTLLFCILILAGIIIGQYIDGKPKIILFFTRLFNKRR